MKWMTIGQVAARSGMTASTIRYYEQIGLLPEPGRQGGQRRYQPEILNRLALIRFARASGLSLRQIRQLVKLDAEEKSVAARWNEVASSRIGEIDEEIERLIRQRDALRQAISCRCQTLSQCSEQLKATSW
jgi:MerR family transcriptional regulator, redox-sensitive transcriptional activator SoxR